MQSASARLCLGGLVGLMWACCSAETRGEEIHLIVSPMPSSAASSSVSDLAPAGFLAPGGLGGYPPMIREL